MVIAIFPLVVAIVGLLIWLLASNGKASEAGRIMFFCGVLVFVWNSAKEVVHIGTQGQISQSIHYS
jgi:hypothetical protein